MTTMTTKDLKDHLKTIHSQLEVFRPYFLPKGKEVLDIHTDLERSVHVAGGGDECLEDQRDGAGPSGLVCLMTSSHLSLIGGMAGPVPTYI